MIRNLLLILFSAILFASCGQSPYYQQVETIPQNVWTNKYRPHFKFNISDTTAAYDMFFIIRHTEAYPYSNIWLWMSVKKPGDTTFERMRIEIPLATPAGQWEGRGMGELWEQRMNINTGSQKPFTRKGEYEIYMEQDMRTDKLPEVLNVGLRIEKVGNNGRGGR